MILQFGWVEMAIPPGFLDLTSYTFRVDEKREEIAVSYFPAPDGLEQVFEEQKKQLFDQTALPFQLEAEGEAEVFGQPALTLSFRFEELGESFLEEWLMAMSGESEAALLSYSRSNRQEEGLPKGLATTAFPAATTPEPPLGSRKHAAGSLDLVLPVRFQAPRVYRFDIAKGTVRVTVAVYPPGKKLPATTIEQDIRTEAYSAQVTDLSLDPVEVEGGEGQQAAYRLEDSDPLEPSSLSARRARLRLGQGSLFLHAKASPKAEKNLETAWQALLAGIRGVKPPSRPASAAVQGALDPAHHSGANLAVVESGGVFDVIYRDLPGAGVENPQWDVVGRGGFPRKEKGGTGIGYGGISFGASDRLSTTVRPGWSPTTSPVGRRGRAVRWIECHRHVGV